MAVAKGPKHAQKDAIEVAVDRRGVQQAPGYDAGEDNISRHPLASPMRS